MIKISTRFKLNRQWNRWPWYSFRELDNMEDMILIEDYRTRDDYYFYRLCCFNRDLPKNIIHINKRLKIREGNFNNFVYKFDKAVSVIINESYLIPILILTTDSKYYFCCTSQEEKRARRNLDILIKSMKLRV